MTLLGFRVFVNARGPRDSLAEYLRVALDLPDGVRAMVFATHTFGEYLDFHP